MCRKKLLELAKQSTDIVEKKNIKFYWTADEFKFNNVNLMRWYEKEFDCWATFVSQQFDSIKKNLADKHLDTRKNYNLEFLRKIREENSYIQFLLSGGYDSTTVFLEAVENNIFLDEIVTHPVFELEAANNIELQKNAIPLYEQHKDKVGKITHAVTTIDMLDELWSDEYAFFKVSTGSKMPMQIGRQTLGRLKTHPGHDNSCYIKCVDKPQLVFYKEKWYAVGLDSHLGGDTSLDNCYYFWYEGDNIKSLIQDARKYRDYILETEKEKTKKHFNFFKLYSQNHLNQILGRREVIDSNFQLPKNNSGFKVDTKDSMHLNYLFNHQRVDVLTKYFTCMKKFHEIFPETKTGFDEYNNKGKFAWLIDIDSLEVFTQQELIPNGF